MRSYSFVRHTFPTMGFGFVLSAMLASCASTRPPVDAFDRTIDGKVAMAPGPITSCRKSDFDTPPVIRLAGRPMYPVGRLLEAKEDVVEVAFSVDENARVHSIKSKSKKDTDRDSVWFRNHIELALSKWELAPALKEGRPVATRCRMLFTFKVR